MPKRARCFVGVQRLCTIDQPYSIAGIKIGRYKMLNLLESALATENHPYTGLGMTKKFNILILR